MSSNLTLVWVLAESANGGTVSLSGRWVTYIPPEGNDAPDSFQFRIHNTDGEEGTGAATLDSWGLNITVIPEPVTFGQLLIFGSALLFVRRRQNRI